MNLTPASSSDLPSAAILTRVSESGTRFTHTAIFIVFSVVRYPSSEEPQRRRKRNPGSQSWQRGQEHFAGQRMTDDGRRSEVPTQAHLHMPRRPGREPALDRRTRHRGILGKGPEADV